MVFYNELRIRRMNKNNFTQVLGLFAPIGVCVNTFTHNENLVNAFQVSPKRAFLKVTHPDRTVQFYRVDLKK